MTTNDDRSILDAIGSTPLVRVGRGTFRTGKKIGRVCVCVYVFGRSENDRIVTASGFVVVSNTSRPSRSRSRSRPILGCLGGCVGGFPLVYFSPSPPLLPTHSGIIQQSPDRTSDRESGPGLGQVRNAKSWGKFLFPYYSTCVL